MSGRPLNALREAITDPPVPAAGDECQGGGALGEGGGQQGHGKAESDIRRSIPAA